MVLHLVVLVALTQQPPPLSFVGFRAGMSMREAQSLIAKSEGSILCKNTTDSRLRECTGSMPFPSLRRPFVLLVSSVRDSVGVMVLSANISEGDTRGWVRALTNDLGKPVYKMDRGSRETWQWVRRGQMLRVVMRKAGKNLLETAVTLTDGPLLDALGPPESKKPD